MTRRPFPGLTPEAWPSDDFLRWTKAKIPGKLIKRHFNQPGATIKRRKPKHPSTWSLSTCRNAERAYGTYLQWQIDRDLFNPDESMLDRYSEESVDRFLTEYSDGRASNTVANVVSGLASMLRACYPPEGIKWLNKLAYALTNEAEPSRPKLPRLATIPELVILGRKLMANAQQRIALGHRHGAGHYRDGLMILMLARKQARRGQLLSLRLNTTLVKENEHWHIKRPEKAAGSKRGIQARLPMEVSLAIDYYLEHVRLKIPKRHIETDEGWFWLGSCGRLRPGSATNRIGELTNIHLGRRVSPHLFRDCVATAIALHAPDNIGITKTALGHTQLSTSQNFYNQAAGFSASADLHDALMQYEE